MHISEGVLSAPVLVGGALLTVGGTYLGLRRLSEREIPKVGILSSSFFVASLIHVPLGPTSVHLVLNGINGLLLGWSAFPSILVALLLQALFFQFGGLTTLGVNTFNMAFPAVITAFLLRRVVLSDRKSLSILGGFIVGFLSVALAGFLVALSLFLAGSEFLTVAKIVFLAHVPVMILEGVITSMAILFIKRVNPRMLISALVLALVLGAFVQPCLAHRVKTFAYLSSDGSVHTETYFTDGTKVKDARVLVYDGQKGELILEGKTDENGRFVFKPPYIAKLNIVVEAEMGHKSQATLDLSETKPAEVKEEVKTPEGVDISKVIEEKLKPIEETLMRLEERLSRPSISEIFGGIGYIFGIFGVWAMLLSRRKKDDERSSP